MEFKNILVPIDFSDASLHAVKLAGALATKTGGRVTLLHIGVIPHFYATEFGLSESSGPLFTQMSQELAIEQKSKLESIRLGNLPPEVATATVIREGWPPEEVLEELRSGSYDLLVMGTHGRTGLKRALLGSVTERVVRECPIPVMVTHGPKV